MGLQTEWKKKENHHHWPCKVSRKSFAKERKETFFLSLLFTILWDGRKSSTRKKEIYKYLIAGKKSRPKLRNNKGKKKKEPRREKKNVMEQRIGIGGSLRNDYFDFFLISYAWKKRHTYTGFLRREREKKVRKGEKNSFLCPKQRKKQHLLLSFFLSLCILRISRQPPENVPGLKNFWPHFLSALSRNNRYRV